MALSALLFSCPYSLVDLAPIRESGPISVADLLDSVFGIGCYRLGVDRAADPWDSIGVVDQLIQ